MANYIAKGAGPGVVLLHGLAASLQDWDPFLPALTQAGFCACALDLLGHGDSAHPLPTAAYTAEAAYHHFRGWLESLRLEGPIVLVGHSFGGYLSLLHSLREPHSVRALVLIDPFYNPRQLAFVLRIFYRRGRASALALQYTPASLMSLVMGFTPNHSAFPQAARRQISRDVKRAAPQIMHIPGSMTDLTPHLSQVTPPVLLLWGDKDPTLAPASFETLLARLPNARGGPVSQSFHQPHITAQKQVEEQMLFFLQQI